MTIESMASAKEDVVDDNQDESFNLLEDEDLFEEFEDEESALISTQVETNAPLWAQDWDDEDSKDDFLERLAVGRVARS